MCLKDLSDGDLILEYERVVPKIGYKPKGWEFEYLEQLENEAEQRGFIL